MKTFAIGHERPKIASLTLVVEIVDWGQKDLKMTNWPQKCELWFTSCQKCLTSLYGLKHMWWTGDIKLVVWLGKRVL